MSQIQPFYNQEASDDDMILKYLQSFRSKIIVAFDSFYRFGAVTTFNQQYTIYLPYYELKHFKFAFWRTSRE